MQNDHNRIYRTYINTDRGAGPDLNERGHTANEMLNRKLRMNPGSKGHPSCMVWLLIILMGIGCAALGQGEPINRLIASNAGAFKMGLSIDNKGRFISEYDDSKIIRGNTHVWDYSKGRYLTDDELRRPRDTVYIHDTITVPIHHYQSHDTVSMVFVFKGSNKIHPGFVIYSGFKVNTNKGLQWSAEPQATGFLDRRKRRFDGKKIVKAF